MRNQARRPTDRCLGPDDPMRSPENKEPMRLKTLSAGARGGRNREMAVPAPYSGR
jgi:hypothetical protein